MSSDLYHENTMTISAPRTTFFALPVELRLQIACYALEQPPNAGLLMGNVLATFPAGTFTRHGPCLRLSRTALSNLSILLVCRQFHEDFTRLAFQKTRFIIGVYPSQVLADRSDDFLKNLRRLGLQCGWLQVVSWRKWPFNREYLNLDELSIAMSGSYYEKELVGLLRRLQNVKALRFLVHDTGTWRKLQLEYNQLIGAILKEDHYQRYDAPNAPNMEATWWDWSYNENENSFTFLAKEPKPIMEEEEYMLLMKPKVDQVMESMERWHTASTH